MVGAALTAMTWSGFFARPATQLAAAEQDAPPPAADARRPPAPPGVQRAIDDLKLSDEQKQKIDPIVQEFRRKQQQAREDFLKQMKEVLNPQQFEEFETAMMRRPPAPPPREDRGATNSPPDQPKASAIPAPDAQGRIAVIFTGGYDTDPRDHGRPVALIAAALNVPSDVFRQAFSNVRPASRDGGPTDAEARRNKQVLMTALGPFGVTDDRLNEVSNYYRYSTRKGEIWRNTPATAYATVRNGVVTITLAQPGAGYSSPPKVSVAGMPSLSATVTLSFGTDFSKNGSIKEVTVQP